jgi:hypothetical protein
MKATGLAIAVLMLAAVRDAVAQSKPVWLTNFGVYSEFSAPSVAPNRAVWEFGVLYSGPRDAFGATLVAEESGFAHTGLFSHWVAEPGVALRYRRWIDESRSVDLSIGGLMGRGGRLSAFGVVTFNLAHWIGVSLRASHGEGSVGVSLSDAPGAILGGVAGLFAIVAAAAAR